MSLDIIETIVSRRIHRVLQGQHNDTSVGIQAEPREFQVKCLDCEFEKTYRYAPGVFGPQSSPGWLYDRMEVVNAVNWRASVPPGRKRSRSALKSR